MEKIIKVYGRHNLLAGSSMRNVVLPDTCIVADMLLHLSCQRHSTYFYEQELQSSVNYLNTVHWYTDICTVLLYAGIKFLAAK